MARSRSNRAARATGAGCATGSPAVSAALQLHLLTETARLFAAPLTPRRILREYVRLLAGNLEVGTVLVLLREQPGADFAVLASRGIPRGARLPARVSADDPLIAPTCADGSPRVLPARAGWRGSRLRPLVSAGAPSLLVLPLAMQREIGGLLLLAARPGSRACTSADVDWFLPIAEQASLALERQALTRKLEQGGRVLADTVRKRTRELNAANRALRSSLAEVRQLRRYSDQVIASLASSLVTFDRDGRVRTVNPPARALLQLGRAPAAGLRLHDLFGAPFADALLAKLGKRAVHITRVQAPIRLSTGEEKVVGYSVTPLLKSGGGAGWIMLFRDISDNTRLERDLRRLDRLVSLGEISANVAHELKNPLTVMYANMEWLLEKAPEELRRRIQITIDHMERMEAIIGRMGILAHDQPLALRTIDACDLVAQMLDFVDKTLREKRIDVDVVLPAEPVLVQGDPAQLQQALLNVIMNAIQAVGADGTLAVRLGRRNRGRRPGLEVSVADSGPGIPRHVIGRIFEPFFTTKETGTGLGLSITRQIVRAHHGLIRAENLEGGGARVRFWLPLEV